MRQCVVTYGQLRYVGQKHMAIEHASPRAGASVVSAEKQLMTSISLVP